MGTCASAGISYLTNSRVTKADLASKALTLESGEVLGYEQLIIATGARVRSQERRGEEAHGCGCVWGGGPSVPLGDRFRILRCGSPRAAGKALGRGQVFSRGSDMRAGAECRRLSC
jgi:NADPH-dependent 2,4-dienoyl-CoA reductase/sulfur reductase-like enzyme